MSLPEYLTFGIDNYTLLAKKLTLKYLAKLDYALTKYGTFGKNFSYYCHKVLTNSKDSCSRRWKCGNVTIFHSRSGVKQPEGSGIFSEPDVK